MLARVNPLEGKTTNWRAVCGKSACTVRREGEPRGSSYPYNQLALASASKGPHNTVWPRTHTIKRVIIKRDNVILVHTTTDWLYENYADGALRQS